MFIKPPDTHHSSLFHTHSAFSVPVPLWLIILNNSGEVSTLLLLKMQLLLGERAERENQPYSSVEESIVRAGQTLLVFKLDWF